MSENTFTLTLRNNLTEPDLIEKIITCDKTWIFQYDPEMKRN